MIFVSPSGNDNSSGTIDAPLATLSAAKEKAKNFDGKVTVYFRAGTYTIENTVNFDADDKSDVVYKAYSNEKVIFTSGSPNTGFDECTVNGVRAFKKDIGKGADFNILFNEKTTLSRTRYPENGYLYVSETSDDDIQPGDDKNDQYHAGFLGMYIDKSKFGDFKNPEYVQIKLLHFWKDETLLIKRAVTSLSTKHQPCESTKTTVSSFRMFLKCFASPVSGISTKPKVFSTLFPRQAILPRTTPFGGQQPRP